MITVGENDLYMVKWRIAGTCSDADIKNLLDQVSPRATTDHTATVSPLEDSLSTFPFGGQPVFLRTDCPLRTGCPLVDSLFS